MFLFTVFKAVKSLYKFGKILVFENFFKQKYIVEVFNIRNYFKVDLFNFSFL